jgi:hypothetical protein
MKLGIGFTSGHHTRRRDRPGTQSPPAAGPRVAPLRGKVGNGVGRRTRAIRAGSVEAIVTPLLCTSVGKHRGPATGTRTSRPGTYSCTTTGTCRAPVARARLVEASDAGPQSRYGLVDRGLSPRCPGRPRPAAGPLDPRTRTLRPRASASAAAVSPWIDRRTGGWPPGREPLEQLSRALRPSVGKRATAGRSSSRSAGTPRSGSSGETRRLSGRAARPAGVLDSALLATHPRTRSST